MKKPGKIKSAVMNWLGVPFTATDVDAWKMFAFQSDSGQSVTPQTVLQLSTVWACARLISEIVGTLPIHMYERTATGNRSATNHPLEFILNIQPNTETVSSVYLESLVASMMLHGGGYSEKLMIGSRLVGLDFLPRHRLQITRRGTGTGTALRYVFTNLDGTQREIPPERIWYVPGWSLDGRTGVSVIQYGTRVFGAALATDSAASGTFARGLLPTTWFKYPKVMKPSQRQEAREFIEQRLSGAINAGRPAILEADMEVGTLGIPPKDAQLLESRAYSVEEICRWFRVPPWMVGHTEKSTSWGSGIEQQMIGFLTFTLSPWLKRIEQSIVKDLLAPAEKLRTYPKYAVEGILRADSAARAAFYSTMVNNGILTRDEVRALEDRAPMGGNAGVLTVQTAMAPLDNLGEIQ